MLIDLAYKEYPLLNNKQSSRHSAENWNPDVVPAYAGNQYFLRIDRCTSSSSLSASSLCEYEKNILTIQELPRRRIIPRFV